MPSQPRTNLNSLCIFTSLAVATFFCAAAVGAFAASAASADQSSYAGDMLDKIIDIWAPPPALKSDFRVSLKVSVDDRGRVKGCTPTESSGLEAFDSSVCGAVRQIGTFGTPPYGAPIDVHLTFWNGTPKGKPRVTPPSSEEALRAEIKARNKAEAALGDVRAEAAEARARERAEAIAKANGLDAPDARPAPIAPTPAPKATEGEKHKKAKSLATPQDDSAPATQLIGRSAPPAGEHTAMPPKEMHAGKADSLPTYGDPALAQAAPRPRQEAPQTAQAQTAMKAAPAPVSRTVAPAASPSATEITPAKYRRNAKRQLRDAILIPVETAPGEYHTRLKLTVSPLGEITDTKVILPTGDKLLDKYVQRGIRRAGSLPPPPADLGGTLDITLRLVRR